MMTKKIFILKILLLVVSLACALVEELVRSPQLVCQHSALNLHCPQHYNIQIISALYGRLSKTVCGVANVTDCYSFLSERIAKEHCDGKARCSLNATNELFGDPCPNSTKYLEVGYSCKRFDGDDRCIFRKGNGNSRDFVFVGVLTGKKCIDKCVEKKKTDPSINGVSIKLTKKERECFCEKHMIGHDDNAEFHSCFLKDDNGILVNLYQQHKMRLKKGKLLTIIRELDMEYELSFEIYPLTFNDKPASVLSLSPAGGSSNDRNYAIPGIKFRLSSTNRFRHSLEICNAVQGRFNYCFDSAVLPLRKWIKVKLKQEWKSSYIYSIYIDDRLVHNVTNSRPYSFSNVEVYAGDPNLDVQNGYIRKLLIRNKWSLQKRGVCFGGKDESFGSFRIKSTGTLTALKLVHQTGLINCSPQMASASNWGCGAHKISVAITDNKRKILFPKNLDETGWTVINPYGSMSKEIILSEPTGRHIVSKGKILRLWYGEDVKDYSEEDNVGESCTDIYAAITTDRWRSDSRCGPNFISPSGGIAECDPSSDKPCCSPAGLCGRTYRHCPCTTCVDYRVREADGWVLQKPNVCIGSRTNLFGTFELKRDGLLEGFKLKHISGGVACKDDSLTNWGCYPSNYSTMNIVVSDENKIVLPSGVRFDRFGTYEITGYTSRSSVLTLLDPFPKYTAQKYFRIGFSEDVLGLKSYKAHSDWTTCFDVYARIKVPQLHKPWSLQRKDVCIGSKQSQYGQFEVKETGLLSGMRLIHKFGGISCNRENITNWGCYRDYKSKINLLLTDRQNKVLLPKGVKMGTNKDYELPGYTALDNEINLLDFKYLRSVTKGEELRVWFNEDLYDVSENDNPDDRTCFDVYTSIIPQPTVFLQLKTINCDYTCTGNLRNDSCLSSLMMNGVELSNQKTGFNILVLNRNLKVSRQVNFDWFKPSQQIKYRAMRDFFRGLDPYSVFFIVLQNVCSEFDRTWYYRLARDVNITKREPRWEKYKSSIIMGCKDGCPPEMIGHVPFSYYGYVKEYGISFRLTGKGAEIAEMPGVITSKTTIITSIVVALLFILIILVLVLYCKRRYYSKKQTTTTLVDDDPAPDKSSVKDGDLIYDYASHEPDKTEHIYAYVDPKTLTDNRAPNGKFAEYITFNGNNAVYKAPSNVPKFEPPLRTPNAMSTPLDQGVAKTRDNHMYTPIRGSYPDLDSPCQYEDMNGYNKPMTFDQSDLTTPDNRISGYDYTVSKETQSIQNSHNSTSYHTVGSDSPGIYMDMNHGHQTYETIPNGEVKKKDDPIYQPLIERRGSPLNGQV